MYAVTVTSSTASSTNTATDDELRRPAAAAARPGGRAGSAGCRRPPRPATSSPADDRDRDRQEHRQHQRQRGGREELPVGHHRGQERAPAPRRRHDPGDGEQHRDQRRQRAQQAQHSHTRRRRSRSPSSTRVTAALRRPCGVRLRPPIAALPAAVVRRGPLPASPVRPVPGQLQHHLLQRAPLRRQPAHRHPGPTRRALSAAGSSARTIERSPLRCTTCPSSTPDRRGRDPACAPAPARSGRAGSSRSASSTSRPAFITPTRVHSASTSLSRWLDSTTVVPCAAKLPQQRAHLADAAGVEAVGGLVEEQQLRLAQQRRGDAEPLPHPQRVRPHRAAVDAAEPDAHQRLLDAVGAVPPRPPRPGGVEQPQVGPPGQVRATPRAPRPAPRPAAAPAPACRGIGPPSTSTRPRWRARARAASGPAWSCPSRSGRAARTATPVGTVQRPPRRRRRRRRKRLTKPSVSIDGHVGPPPGQLGDRAVQHVGPTAPSSSDPDRPGGCAPPPTAAASRRGPRAPGHRDGTPARGAAPLDAALGDAAAGRAPARTRPAPRRTPRRRAAASPVSATRGRPARLAAAVGAR